MRFCGEFTMMKRLAIAFFYDEAGIVDDYYIHFITALKPFVDRTIFVSNGPLTKDSERKVEPLVDEQIVRKNTGYDVWAYKAALDKIGWDKLDEYDEILLFNHTFYGPIYPLTELFDEMDSRRCDFWGISAHAAEPNNFFNPSEGELPFHLNSHFIAVRRSMHRSQAFRAYWSKVDEIRSYTDSVVLHETRFTKHFQKLGYVCSVYIDPADYHTSYPVMMEVDKTLENRSPILKKRLFFNDTTFLEAEAIDLPHALSIVEKTSDYDLKLIWNSIGRISQPRILNNNAGLISIFPHVSAKEIKTVVNLKIAVCAHVYYVDMLEELLVYAKNISIPYDFIITTDTPEKKAEIEAVAARIGGYEGIFVLVCESNDGRDTSALLISCREFFLDDRYNLVCRIHTKRSPQDGSKGVYFKRHMLENLLGSKGFVDNILTLFATDECIGLACPALIHIGYPTMGHSWFSNKDNVRDLVSKLNLNVQLDDNTPVAPNGGMYWFRPKALRPLFAYPWSWKDFSEQVYSDGSLPHAIERTIGYVAIDQGYMVRHLLTTENASHNYVMLEAKLQAILGALPLGEFRTQLEYVRSNYDGDTIKASARRLVQSIKKSILYRSPILFRTLRPIYRVARNATRFGTKPTTKA